MGKRRSTPPPAPDYAGIAQQQAQMQRQNMDAQTQANRPNQVGPWGSVTWSQDGSGNWTQNTQLAPELQQALGSQIGLQSQRSQLAGEMMGGVRDALSRPFDFGALPGRAATPQSQSIPVPTMVQGGQMQMGIGPTQGYVDQAGDALYQRQTSRLDPRFQQQEQALRSRMINSGITEGSEAWNTAFDNFSRDRNDAYANASRDAITMAGQEASRLQGMDLNAGRFANDAQQQRFGQDLAGAGQFFNQSLLGGQQRFNQDLAGANFQNANRAQAMQEALMQRNMPLNDLNALLSGQQVTSPTFQNFTNAGLYQTPDLMGSAQSTYQSQLDAFNANQANRNSLLQGGFGLAGSIFGGPMGGMIGSGIGRAFGF